MHESLLAARGLSVRYGPTLAVDRVDLDVCRGEIHAVVGENGAGKSTLLRVVAGVLRRVAGSVRLPHGVRVAWAPQETQLPADLTAAEWVFLGCELRGRLGWLRRRAMHEAARAAFAAIDCSVAPTARLGALAAPQRKQVQLARTLRGTPDLLLLDEPTAVLGDAETRPLFATIRALSTGGAGVLYVSHRLDEVLAIADRVTVLRDGKVVSTDPVGVVDTATLVQRMVGRPGPPRPSAARILGPTALRLVNVATAHVRGLSLSVRRGEVIGLAGLVGAGRSEVLEAIAGVRPVRSGRIESTTVPYFVPEDRISKGLIPTLGVRDNVCLPADGWLLRRARETAETRRWIAQLGIRTGGTEAAIDSLSGGNQQKLLLARVLRHQPGVLLLDEPTAGVDVGAKADIHDLIRQRAAAGAAIVLASSDLPELLMLCDRIVALREGAMAGSLAAEEASEPRLAALITGASWAE